MTIVEFFDKSHTNNIIGSLTMKPDKVIFIIDDKSNVKNLDDYAKVLKSKKINADMETVKIGSRKFEDVISVLRQIASKEKDCSFDLNGGTEEYMLALGMVLGEDKNIKAHKINPETGEVIFYPENEIKQCDIPMLTVEENIVLHGGRIVYKDKCGKGSENWDFTEEFFDDIEKMWDVCRQDCKAWNLVSQVYAHLFINSNSEDETVIDVERDCLINKYMTSERHRNFIIVSKMLLNCGIVTQMKLSSTNYYIQVKNKQIKECLLKSGTVLELITYKKAVEKKDKSMERYYNDVLTGVCIEWKNEGKVNPKNQNTNCDPGAIYRKTENEIDVIAMKGVYPTYISCKNGSIGEAELYKLKIVSDKFGGSLSKKKLVATYLGSSSQSVDAIKQRAEYMGIELHANVHRTEWNI